MTAEIRRKALRWAGGMLLPCALMAQPPQQQQQPSKPDSPGVKAHVDRAKQVGGSEWAIEANMFCEGTRPKVDQKAVLEPTKIFDNVYVVGQAGTAQYVITTPEGIILIDSGFVQEEESVLLPAFKKLDLDPAQIKILIVSHGHPDHFGGALYLQEHYHPKIYLSAQDWDFMTKVYPVENAKKKKPDPPSPPPQHDMVMQESQPIGLGGEKVTPVFTPGHTPGSMGLIFDVMDQGKRHVAAIWGGTILAVNAISTEGLQEYVRSLAHFGNMTEQAKVDVELQNHPFYDGFQEKLAKVRERKPSEPNPFIVGQANYSHFVEVMSECVQAQIGRRAE